MKRVYWILSLFTFASLILFFHLREPLREFRIGPLRLECAVQGFPKPGYWNTVTCLASGKRYLLRAKKPMDYLPGQWIEVTGWGIQPQAPRNPGEWDYEKYLRSQGITGLVEAGRIRTLGTPGAVGKAVAAIRNKLKKILKDNIPSRERPLVEAVLLGNRAELDRENLESFSNSGLYHLLAISGLHVGLMAWFLLQLLSLFRLPRKSALALTLAILVIYVPVTGSGISVIRATCMYFFFGLSEWFERSPWTVNNLGWALALCVVFMPYQVLSLGFQLSFIATFFLLYYSKILQSSSLKLSFGIRLLREPAAIFLSSFLLFLVTLPLLAHNLHQAAPWSIVGNIGGIAATTLLVFSGLFTVFWDLIFPAGAEILGQACGFFSRALVSFAQGTAALRGSGTFIGSFTLPGLIFLLFSLFLFPWIVRGKRTVPFLLIAAFTGSLWFMVQELKKVFLEEVRLTFLYSGQGDATVLQLPGLTALVDAGPGGRSGGAGKKQVLPFLKSQGINALNWVLITHGDWDHFGGLFYLLPRVSIGKVYYNGAEVASQSWKRLELELLERKIPLLPLRCGDTLYSWSDISIFALHPCEQKMSAKNENSVVIKVQGEKESVLLTGDIESKAEELLSQKNAIATSVLKVAHHGSSTSTSEEFLRKTSSRYAIISAGEKNRFGHPSKEVLMRLRKNGTQVFLTSRHGATSYGWKRFQDHGELRTYISGPN